MRRAQRLVLVVVTLVAMGAAAQGGERGLFTGEEWRYRREELFTGLAKRIVADLVAIPTGVTGWDAPDWAFFGTMVGSTVALSVGRPSLDVGFQAFLQERVLGVNHFTTWNTAGDVAIWSSVGVATLAMFIYGLAAGNAGMTECSVLMLEAFAVAQIYHQMIKLLVGRAGPNRPELEGQYFGPVEAVKLWPSGTPSGHMASMYAMLSVLMYFWDEPLLWVGLNLAAIAFGASLVGDNYHWLSDVVLGAGLGFAVGRWVVQHRSTRYRAGSGPAPIRVNVMPVLLPDRGAGLAAVLSF